MATTQLLPQREVSAGPDPEFGLADRLRKAREHAGFREQRPFASVLGISQKSVSNYEAGKIVPKKLVLREWARVTGVRLEWLVGEAWPGEAVRLDHLHPSPGHPDGWRGTSDQRITASRCRVYRAQRSYRIRIDDLDGDRYCTVDNWSDLVGLAA